MHTDTCSWKGRGHSSFMCKRKWPRNSASPQTCCLLHVHGYGTTTTAVKAKSPENEGQSLSCVRSGEDFTNPWCWRGHEDFRSVASDANLDQNFPFVLWFPVSSSSFFLKTGQLCVFTLRVVSFHHPLRGHMFPPDTLIHL